MAYEDLLKDTTTTGGGGNDYFLVTVTDLDVNQSYPIQFRWKYNDGTFSPWSAVKIISTPGESEPNTPRFLESNVDVSTPGFLKITWDGLSDDTTPLVDLDRVDIYIDGLPFDGTKPAGSFKTAGTQVIAAPGGTYQIALYAVSKLGKLSPVSTAVTKTVSDISNPVVNPETPEAPTVTAGLASVIVEWSGKKTGGVDFTTGSFAGAKVFIGTTAGFTPSDNNWVHTLNFANGSNKVSIGVGTIIDKSLGTLLQYDTPYYVKIDTVNASGTPNNNPIAASGNPITVNKVAASEIVTGTLAADASITAGISGGSRVVLSGGANPLVIYGTNGTTELLKFIGGATGTLTINGGGTFTGDLSAGSGSSIFKSDTSGIYLGNSVFASAPFSVSRNGILKAEAGTIGGWTLGSTYLQNASTSPTIKIDTTGIIVGSTSSPYIDITSSGITHRNANGTASGKFTLTTGPSASLSLDGTFTISGTSTIDGTAASTVKTGAASGASALQDGNGVTKNASNQVTRISTSGGIVVSSSTASSGSRVEMTNSGFYAYNSSNQETVGIDASTGAARFTGTITSSGGTIGGWSISANGISSGAFTNYLNSTTGDATFGGALTVSGVITSISAMNISYSGNAYSYISNLEIGGNMRISGGFGVSSDWSPDTDGTTTTGRSLGQSSQKWRRVFAANSTIQTSDARLKTDVEDAIGLEFINKLRPVKYRYINGDFIPVLDDDGNPVYEGVDKKGFPKIKTIGRPGIRKHWGFIAQEVKQAVDEAGIDDFAGWVKDELDDPDSLQSLSYEQFISPMVKAIQELSSKVDSLTSRLDALEG